jgi:hypothetical protein
LVPFPILKPNGGGDSSEYLCERFSLLAVPSLMSLRSNQRSTRTIMTTASKTNAGAAESSNNMSALVIGNPLLPGSVTEQWGWGHIPHAEQEAVMVADMLQAQALLAAQVLHSDNVKVVNSYVVTIFISSTALYGPWPFIHSIIPPTVTFE